jgi:hypothetical protein
MRQLRTFLLALSLLLCANCVLSVVPLQFGLLFSASNIGIRLPHLPVGLSALQPEVRAKLPRGFTEALRFQVLLLVSQSCLKARLLVSLCGLKAGLLVSQ